MQAVISDKRFEHYMHLRETPAIIQTLLCMYLSFWYRTCKCAVYTVRCPNTCALGFRLVCQK